jgi:hypothetical protein
MRGSSLSLLARNSLVPRGSEERRREYLGECVQKHYSALTNRNEHEKRRFWFLGEANGRANLFIISAVFFFNFLIWNMKLRKEMSHFSSIENNWLELVDNSHKQSRKICEAVLLVNFDICRRWHG